MKLIYVAHVFGGSVVKAHRAEYWTAALNERIEGGLFFCPWLPMVRHWVDSGESRERGMRLDLEFVLRSDALLALSPLVGGVLQEWEVATNKILCDTSTVSAEPARDWLGFAVIQSWVDSLSKGE